VAGKPSIAVIGGSGFYELLASGEEIKAETPFGAPSDTIVVGEGSRAAGRVPAPARP
jgi:5'-methylthioadenosine phosphorylase